MDVKTIELILEIALFVSVLLVFAFLGKYIKDFKIIELLSTKIKGDAYAYDRVRREQMKIDIEQSRGVLNASKKKSRMQFTTLLFKKIELSGLRIKFPGFSESMFLALSVVLGLIIFCVTNLFFTPMSSIVVLIAFFIIEWALLGIIVYQRKINVETQLLQFVNSVASASRQYADIIDIIGSVYDQFSGAFREALEQCYVTAKTTNNTGLAFDKLKSQFDTQQLAFVIDNFKMCSTSTGDYYTVATDLSKTIEIYSNSREKVNKTLKNAKINISAMFVIAIAIAYMLGIFFEGGLDIILHTFTGQLIIISMILIFIYGMSMKAE